MFNEKTNCMERNRIIHTLRETSYKVDIKNRLDDEDLTVNVFGTDNKLIGAYYFESSQLQGKKSIHFYYKNGEIEWSKNLVPSVCSNNLSISTINEGKKNSKENDRDESYVIDLCDKVLGLKAKRQHCFSFLLGDSGRRLPVDAYYEELKLVIEYCERQHSEPVPFFDRRLTVSGVGRGEQRKIYDERRKEILPQHDIRLISILYSDFECDSKKRIIRDCQRDKQIVKKILEDYINI